MKTINLHFIADRLDVAYKNIDQSRKIALWLLEKLLDKTGPQILISPSIDLNAEQSKTLEIWLDQIINQHKPYQYVLGDVPFLNLDILVEPPVLIPRLETEWWVDILIQSLSDYQNEPVKILDLCAGSGCIGLALAASFTKSQVTSIDILSQACDLINKNKIHNRIANLEVLQSDLYAQLGEQKFDLIVSNPPYVPRTAYDYLDPSVRLWEDQKALVSPLGDLGIICKIIKKAPNFLQKRYDGLSQLWIEIDETQGDLVSKLMEHSFNSSQLLLDQFNIPRVIVGKI